MTNSNKYDPQAIEKKWQALWEREATFRVAKDTKKPKYYVLDMFPYPSGAGLHVGHVEGYTATDIIARYKRQKGYAVLHPMGWDSFGLPAEQYAVRTGTHPAVTTQKNIDTYRRQLKRMGFSYDWDRELATSDPTYYRWTQWIFTKLYERGLAYEAQMLVNFCPALGSVLSNEEVENGLSVEGGYPVERRPLRQWVLKITAYAERLLEDLSLLDWPEHLKRMQTNWIGKSEGMLVSFKEANTQFDVQVFTTRADTLFGVTYLVVAPEHPLIDQVTTEEQKEQVAAYRKLAAGKSDLERGELEKDKTGVWTGAFVVNPVTGEKIPLWVADYVLMGYGTGAVMAVPAHDLRDFAFACKYALPIRPVLEPDIEAHLEDLDPGEDPGKVKEQVLKGERCWPHDGKCLASEHDDLSLNGKNIQEAVATAQEWLERKGLGKKSTQYRLRDWLFSRQRYWGEPIPILHFEDGTKRALGADELPLCPPQVDDYKPTESGESPLAHEKEWVEVVDPKTGKKAKRETNTMPQWAGSCWYYLRFCDAHNDKEAFSPEEERYWLPVDLYVGGAEHAVLHLLYARFWHKVLYDCGLVSTKEPFHRLCNPGVITARSYRKAGGAYVAPEEVEERGGRYYEKASGEELKSLVEKMSKSKLNGVSPDEVVEEFGADAVRLYEMFMGPLDKEKVWNTESISGCRRFLSRVYDMVMSDKVQQVEPGEQALRLVHRLLSQVAGDLEKLSFNTAIAKMMEFLNEFSRFDVYPKELVEKVVLAISPFAPHLAEECWERLGHKGSLAFVPFPEAKAQYLVEEKAICVVQVNGKLRGRFEVKKGATQEQLLAMAHEDASVAKYLTGELVKVVYVQDKLLNVVVR